VNPVAREREVSTSINGGSGGGGSFGGNFGDGNNFGGSGYAPNIGYSSDAASRQPPPPPPPPPAPSPPQLPPGIPQPTIARPSGYIPQIKRKDSAAGQQQQQHPQDPFSRPQKNPQKLAKIRQFQAQKQRNRLRKVNQRPPKQPQGGQQQARPQSPPPPPPPPPSRRIDPRRKQPRHSLPQNVFENARSGGILPQPQPLKAEDPNAAEEEDEEDVGTARSPQRSPFRSESSGIANFLGLRLPELPSISLPFFGSQSRRPPPPLPQYFGDVVVRKSPAELAALKQRVKSEAIPISLGRTPHKDALKVDSFKINRLKLINFRQCNRLTGYRRFIVQTGQLAQKLY
jgi:hypothetical protein